MNPRLLTASFTHSIFFALRCGALAAPFARALRSRPRIVFAFIGAVAASHGLLDAFTTGGSGVAFFWPFGDARYFMPLKIILVSPRHGFLFAARHDGAVV